MKKRNKILSLCLGLVLALGVTGCNDISDLLDEGTGDGDTTESDTSGEGSGDTGDGGEQEKDKVLVTSLTFNASSYSVEVGGSTPYSVSVEPSDATNKNYSIGFYSVETHVVTTTIATTDEAGTSIIGLSAGECYIVATALDGSGVYDYASVTVNAKDTPITALRLSQEEITIDAGASFTISSLEGSDVVVTPDPVNADNPAWTIEEVGTSYLTVSTRGTDNTYTVEASEEGAGKTASLVLTAEADNTVTATLTVHISEVVADTHPVTGITLTKEGTSISELTLTSGESLTIGAVGSDADIIVEISPDNADEVGFTVSSENSDAVTISEPDQETGIVTVTALDNTSWTTDKEATITVTTAGKDASGSTLSANLKVIVPRPVEYVNKLEVTPKSISLVTNEEILLTSLDGFSVTIYNQYNEVMSGVDWTASVTSGTEYLELSGSTSSDYSIKAVSEGSATITITASGTQISDTIAVSITDKVYNVTTIEMDANQYDLGYGQGGETSQDYPASIDLAQHVKYLNTEAEGGLASSSQYGVTAEITSGESYITLSGTVVTAIGVGSATVTLTSTTNTGASVVANIVVTDITDYTPTGITCSTTAFTVSNGSTTTLSEAITGVSVVPAYASQDYVVMVASGSESYLSISEGVLSATNTTNNDVEATLLVYPLYNNEAYTSVTPATIAVTVKTDYVAVESVTLSSYSETLTVGGSVDLVATVTPSTATDASTITWSSDAVDVASVSNGHVTALSAGTANITASCGGVTSNACVITVNAAFSSYTLNITISDGAGTYFEDPHDSYAVYVGTAYDGTGNGTWGDYHQMDYNSSTHVYSYKFTNMPGAGTYETCICPGDENGADWYKRFETFDWVVSGDESGDAIKEYNITYTECSTWDELFPALGTEDESFYVVLFDDYSDSSTYYTSSLYLYGPENSTLFGTSRSSAVTIGKSSGNQTYMYNSVVGTAKANFEGWFGFASSDWSYEVDLGNLTIPTIESGKVGIYVAVCNSNYMSSSERWSPWYPSTSFPDNITISESGWVTSYSSVSEFITAVGSTWVK